MKTIESLYQLFDVLPNCSNDELRRAYLRALLAHHPDKNLHDIDAATVRTQEINIGYAKLKEIRANKEYYGDDWQTVIVDEGLIIEVSFGNVDLDDIAERKSSFQNDWKRYKKNSSDPVASLRLINSAFRAERANDINELLLNPILIDSATILLSFVDKDSASATFLKWAEYLRKKDHVKEAVQLLEDVFAAGIKWETVTDVLRSLHYSWAKYVDPITGGKPSPEVSIVHLNRIIELGFKYDYIYKFLAEAYYVLGDVEKARSYLAQAYQINPELAGAVKISSALGFSSTVSSSNRTEKKSEKYKWSRLKQIPTPKQVYEWAVTENWDPLIEFANPNHYSPRIISKARRTFDQIADSLGKYRDQKSIDALINLIDLTYYWDVKATAVTSLSKIGEDSVYSFLERQTFTNTYGEMHLKVCLSYLKSRLDKNLLAKLDIAPENDLFIQAKQAYKKKEYGKARVILEYLLGKIEPTYSSYFEIKILLARSCAEMSDVSTSIELTEPIFHKLPKKLRDDISSDLESWIYRILMSHGYSVMRDEQYQCGIEILLERSLAAKKPDEILDNLRAMTRWLELLGLGDLAQWVRQLIRLEAPGTWYVDGHDRVNYIQTVDLSPDMKKFFGDMERQLKSEVAFTLQRVIKSTAFLNDANSINDNN
jgi:tetratricopeptide (TPR) repeat protein